MISVIVLNNGNSQFDTVSLKVISALKYGVKFLHSKYGKSHGLTNICACFMSLKFGEDMYGGNDESRMNVMSTVIHVATVAQVTIVHNCATVVHMAIK